MINPLLEKGLLPNLQRMIINGFSSKLQVTIPPATIPSWPCLFSGITPEQLGYYWFTHPEKGLFSSFQWRKKAIFSLPELKSFILNLPGTYPAWNINGEMICGMLSPKLSFTPEKLTIPHKKNWIIDGRNIQEIFRAFKIKSDYFLNKIKENFDFMSYIIRMPDAISHHAHKNLKKTLQYINYSYIKIDNFIGKILRYNKYDNIFIISDHGLRYYREEFNLFRWLEKKGIIEINRSTNDILINIMLKLYDVIRKRIERNFLNFFSKKIPRNFKINLEPQNNKSKKNLERNYIRIKRYTGNTGGVYLKNDKKSYLELIEHILKKCKDIKKIVRGKIVNYPDLFICLKDNLIFSEKASYFVRRNRTTISHQEKGIIIAYGKNIKKMEKDVVQYYDLVPTLLYLYNLEKSQNLIGKSLEILKK